MIATAIESLDSGCCTESDVTSSDSEFLDKLMYTGGCDKLDLLVRTSGEIRLSDFLLYQVSECILMI